jgi:hypothetical protein
MLRRWIVAGFVLGLVGCGEKLTGTSWEGSYTGGHETKIALAFEGNDVAKLTVTDYSEPKTESLTYAFDGKAVKLTGVLGVIRGTLTLENGQLVSNPSDMGFASAKEPKIVLTKKR